MSIRKKSEVESQYSIMRALGRTEKQDVDQWEMVRMIMSEGYRKSGKIWWFAYEVTGFHEIGGRRYFMSYKAGTRLSELTLQKYDEVEGRKTDGRLHVYALKSVMRKSASSK